MNTAIHVLFCIAAGYFLGCINPAYIFGRLRGYDIRKQGSGNAGASNAAMMMGKRTGVIVAVLDILKTALSWWAAELVFPINRLLAPIAAVSCVFGHMYPVTMGFHGGKGLACLGGIVLAYSPKALLILFCVALAIAVITNYLCITTSVMAIVVPVYIGCVRGSLAVALILLIPAIPIIMKHRVNFRRIKEKKELRFSALWNKKEELARIGIIE